MAQCKKIIAIDQFIAMVKFDHAVNTEVEFDQVIAKGPV
jgi:hypothetical protein